MIGKVIIGKSFRGCIAYCLEDKKLRHDKSITNQRAEVVQYNLCFGNKKELAGQFNEVRRLNQKLSKPVLHITLSLADGERLSRQKLQQVVEDCAKYMGFDENQYLAVEHLDTKHQHLHIVANRVGFDGRTLSDSNSYKKIAEFCRQTELKYGLKQVLSPKRFLPKELRQIPRNDIRKQTLETNIINALFKANTYAHFAVMMKERGYRIERGRGIAFIDRKGVRTKGSEVGFSLNRIEKILGLKTQRIEFKQVNQNTVHHFFNEKLLRSNKQVTEEQNLLKEMFQNLMHAEQQNSFTPSELLHKKKKKKQSRSIHL